MKPDTPTAMRILIGQIRDTIPFDSPRAPICTGTCEGCSMKLLEFLDSELTGWERRLDTGERPGLGDLSRLAGTARKIHTVLARNGLVGTVIAADGRATDP
jgi:hypothetical protein